MKMIDAIVEINGKKYVLWYHMEEYKLCYCIHATPLKDWEKLKKDYEEDMDEYWNTFGSIFVYTYDELKEDLEEYYE